MTFAAISLAAISRSTGVTSTFNLMNKLWLYFVACCMLQSTVIFLFSFLHSLLISNIHLLLLLAVQLNGYMLSGMGGHIR